MQRPAGDHLLCKSQPEPAAEEQLVTATTTADVAATLLADHVGVHGDDGDDAASGHSDDHPARQDGSAPSLSKNRMKKMLRNKARREQQRQRKADEGVRDATHAHHALMHTYVSTEAAFKSKRARADQNEVFHHERVCSMTSSWSQPEDDDEAKLDAPVAATLEHVTVERRNGLRPCLA